MQPSSTNVPKQLDSDPVVLQASSATHSESIVQDGDEKTSILGTFMDRVHSAEDVVLNSAKINKSEHKYPHAFFRITVACALLMLLCFTIWIMTTPYGYPWFVHVFHLFGMVIAITFAAGSKSKDWKGKLFTIHSCWTAMSICMFFIINTTTGRYPWWVYPSCAIFFLYSIHFVGFKLSSYFNLLTIHTIFYFVLNVMLFVIYCYSNASFPWNLIVLAVGTILIAVHAVLHVTLWPKIKAKFQGMFANKALASAKNNSVATNPSLLVAPPPNPELSIHDDSAFLNNATTVNVTGLTPVAPIMDTPQRVDTMYPSTVSAASTSNANPYPQYAQV